MSFAKSSKVFKKIVAKVKKYVNKNAPIVVKKAEKITEEIIKHEAVHFTVMAGVIIVALIILYFFLLLLRSDESGLDYFISQVLYIFIVGFVAWIIMRLFTMVLLQMFKLKTDKHVPRYIITLFNWGVSISAILFITTAVFGQSAWSLVTAGGIVGAGIAFSVQGIVLDMISGLILDVERTYKKGDWIRLYDKTVGEVIHTSWRHIQVKTEFGSFMVIPNRELTSNHYENLSRFGRIYGDEITLSIDHNVQIERAERVLMDALLGIPEVVKTGIYGVYAESVNEGGVVFTLRFGVEGYGMLRPIRHKVLAAATSKLHSNGMHISETIGEYTLSKAVPLVHADELPVKDVLRNVKIFDALNDKEIDRLSAKAKRYLIDSGDDIIVVNTKSDSLFVIAEGVVDVIVPIKEGKKTLDKVVATLGAGSFVGDRALLLGEKRSATVRARTKVLTYEVTKAAFKPLLKARPAMVKELSNIVLERELETAGKVSEAKKGMKKKDTLREGLIKGIEKFFGI